MYKSAHSSRKLGFKWKLKHLLDKMAVDKTTVKEMAADELRINY